MDKRHIPASNNTVQKAACARKSKKKEQIILFFRTRICEMESMRLLHNASQTKISQFFAQVNGSTEPERSTFDQMPYSTASFTKAMQHEASWSTKC
jgi:hypothetical protein